MPLPALVVLFLLFFPASYWGVSLSILPPTHQPAGFRTFSPAQIFFSASDPDEPLFGFVAKNPGKNQRFCHVFLMRKHRHADQVQALVNKAFRLAFTNERTLGRRPKRADAGAASAGAGAGAVPPRAAEPTRVAKQQLPKETKVAAQEQHGRKPVCSGWGGVAPMLLHIYCSQPTNSQLHTHTRPSCPGLHPEE